VDLHRLQVVQGLVDDAVVGHALNGGLTVTAFGVGQAYVDAEVGKKGWLISLLEARIDGKVAGVDPLLLAVVGDEGRDAGTQGDHEQVGRGGRTPLAPHRWGDIGGDALPANLGLEQHITLITCDCDWHDDVSFNCLTQHGQRRIAPSSSTAKHRSCQQHLHGGAVSGKVRSRSMKPSWQKPGAA